LVDGSLVVGVEIEVIEAGRFHVEATLYGAGGTEKIAWAQTAQVLEPGTHWLVLSYVALSTTTEMPNAKNRVAENPYQTATYDVSAFADRSYDDPQLLEAAE